MRTSSWLTVATPGLVCLLALGQTIAQAQPKQLNPSQQIPVDAHHAAVKLPAHFRAYASEPIGEGRLCVVGVSTDEDGMYQKPVVYVEDAESKRVLWVTRLKFPAWMNQSRATHCDKRGASLYVLQQTETQAPQSLSQTLLNVVKLNASTGALQTREPVRASDAYSNWVDGGVSNFHWRDDHLVIVGRERPDADRENIAEFKIRLKANLKP